VKLNCKEGDIAVLIKQPKCGKYPVLGRLVTVLYSCPTHVEFKLPDGYTQQAVFSEFPYWVVEWDGPLKHPITGPAEHRICRHSILPDYALCPIRDPGEDAKDETLSWLPVPFPQLERA
jgi:hypothetical protein